MFLLQIYKLCSNIQKDFRLFVTSVLKFSQPKLYKSLVIVSWIYIMTIRVVLKVCALVWGSML